jgi:tetratricopeptide (TPR) repeat protein
MMKKQFKLLAVMILCSGLILAQSSKRTSAHNALEDFKRDKDPTSLKKAKDFIDMASQHSETGVEAKTWVYRGDIYMTSYAYLLQSEDDKQKDEKDPIKKSAVSYVNASATDLQTATESYMKAKQFDKKNTYVEDVIKGLVLAQAHYENKGRADYNNKKPLDAGASFEKCNEISVFQGKIDTANIDRAALAYRIGGEMSKAKPLYQKLIDLGYGKAKTIAIYGNLLINEKDTAAARKIIVAGRQKYPNDMELLTAETNLFLMAHKNKEALANLKMVLEKSPNDPKLNLIVGSIFDNMANPKDEKGKELPKPAEYEDYLKQSEAYYKKTIKLKPDGFDALYNLGVLYNNEGVIINNKANDMKDKKLADKEFSRADDLFKEAIPYFEKAHGADPKHMDTMRSLKLLYYRTQQMEKYEKIKAELEAAK